MKKSFVAITLCAVLLTGCGSKEVPVEEEILRSVEVITIGTDTISSDFAYSGKAAPSKEIDVMPTIPGKVVNFNYEVGDKVKEGAVLFTVDSTDLQNNLRSSQASYEAAKLNADNALKVYENNKTLFEQEIIAEAELDKMKFAYESAAANLTTLEVQMDVIKKNIGDCTVTSPMSGVIATRGLERGSFATQSSPAYTLMDLSVIKVEVGVSEQAVNHMAVGDTVMVDMSAAAAEPMAGKISTISPAANQTGTYTVKIELNNSKGLIKAGMLAEVRFTREKAEEALVLPRNAVMTKDDQSYVYVVEGTTAKKVVVETGIETGETIQITSNLQEGAQVVTRGQTYLADGEQVIVTNLPSPGETTSGSDEAKGE